MAEDVREDAMKNTLSFAALLSLTLLPAYAQKTVEYRQFTVPAMRYIAAGPEGNALVSLTRRSTHMRLLRVFFRFSGRTLIS